MRSYAEIHAIAAARKGGVAALEALLAPDQTVPDAATLPEDRWLAQFTRFVFSAGFNWKVIEAKWDGFEAAFGGFDVDTCAMINDDRFDALLKDRRIVRNGAKVMSVRDNAVFLRELRSEGGAAAVFSGWSPRDFVGLLGLLKTRGSRLGGSTGQYGLRFAGVDSFVLSADVTARLVTDGVIDRPATSKRAMAAVQASFNTWMDESDRTLTAISRTLAYSI